MGVGSRQRVKDDDGLLGSSAGLAHFRSVENKIQNAVDQTAHFTGFGKFHCKLFVISGLIFMNTGFGVSSTGIIVPSAPCDFQMRTVDIGRLTASPMLGMVCGSYFWGCLADMKGRKVALLAALFLDGFAGVFSSLVPNLLAFTCLRFLNGFAITGQCAMLFPYLGEFQPSNVREKILCWMEMAWTIGITVLPLLGWLVIPMSFRYTLGNFSFASWNLFVLLCAVPSISIAIALLYFPESPKYLIDDGQESRAIEVLSIMYAENTGNPPEDYPVKCIANSDDPANAMIVNGGDFVASEKLKRKKKKLVKMVKDIYEHTLTILRPPYLTTTLLTSIIQFSITSSYYTLMVWFPELFQRFAEFEKEHPSQSATVCDVSEIKPINVDSVADFSCNEKVQSSVYIHTIFLGLACIPTSIWLPLCIGQLGYRFFLVFSTAFSGAAAIGLFFVTSSTQNLILSCVFEALTSMGVSVVYCILVDFYPTHLRVIAASFSALCGRSGAFLGNFMFGYFLDVHCVVPIAVVAGLLFCGGLLSMCLPRRNVDPGKEERKSASN
ncbi:synaptic vesicle glycoprotein 2C-like isoform X2 [Athalia rosae]|uniref:synaptic vesicle glycoprotein 2C-like isoform X2 n=1 Tax=Athalia rosae TaxID=37344 RepID=UPI00203489B8|nr:synaptic vesicle glycoprotein 2C-like isoform X2 [Athalia rosae]